MLRNQQVRGSSPRAGSSFRKSPMRAQIGTPRKTLLKDAEEAADLVLQPRRD